MKVLVIEDDLSQRLLLERGLAKSKFTVWSCTSVDEAILSLDKTQFAVAVVDLGLLDRNGYEFVRELVCRSLQTKVIIHTTNATFQSAKEGIDLGIFAFVEKSRGLAELVRNVELASTAFLKDSLSEAEKEIRLQVGLLDSVQEGVIAVNLQKSVIYANKYAIEKLGYTPKDILGKDAGCVFDCPNRAPSSQPFEHPSILMNDSFGFQHECEFSLSVKNSSVDGARENLTHIKLKTSPIMHAKSGTLGHVLVFSDVTEQRKAEFELDNARRIANHAQRLSIMGQIAGDLAHEINQPLGAISNFAGGLILGLAHSAVPPAELGETLNKIQVQAMRASDIVSQLRRFVSSGPAQQNTIDIQHLIGDSIKLMECDFRSHDVLVSVSNNSQSGYVIGDKVQLTQVLVNVLKNAAESIDQSNAIHREITVETVVQKPFVNIFVRDTGTGVDPKIAAKIFDPYYTTKKGGMGLGLSISKSIMENHRGAMQVTSSTAHGSTFRLQLPAVEVSPEEIESLNT